MKFFFAGALHLNAGPTIRAKTLRDLGNEVELFDTKPYEVWGGIYISYLLRRTGLVKINHAILNKQLAERAIASKPDVLWIDKGRYVCGATLRKIKEQTDATIVYDTLDYMFAPFNKTWQVLSSIPEYDLIVTMRKDHDEYYEHGAKKVLRLWCGYYQEVFKPVELSVEDEQLYSAEVMFCGTPEIERAETLVFLINHGINVKIWGVKHDWKRLKCFKQLESHFIDSYLHWPEYAKSINASKIGLCFLKKVSKDEHTFRSLEIPACGAFMAAERTNEHMELFEEDKEAIFFSSNQELLDKIRYYLSHDEERKQIADAGRKKCVDQDYTFHRKYSTIMQEIKKIRHGISC